MRRFRDQRPTDFAFSGHTWSRCTDRIRYIPNTVVVCNVRKIYHFSQEKLTRSTALMSQYKNANGYKNSNCGKVQVACQCMEAYSITSGNLSFHFIILQKPIPVAMVCIMHRKMRTNKRRSKTASLDPVLCYSHQKYTICAAYSSRDCWLAGCWPRMYPYRCADLSATKWVMDLELFAW